MKYTLSGFLLTFSVFLYLHGFSQGQVSGQQIKPIVKPISPSKVVNWTQLANDELANPKKYKPKRQKKRFIEQGEEREKNFKFKPLPIAPGATVFHAATPPLAGPRAASPEPTGTWNGVLDNGTEIPPDIEGAVGLTYLIETTNQQFNIYTKTGTLVSTVSITHLFAATDGNGYFDPHVKYDPNYGRYIICIDGNNKDGNSGLFIAVSESSDPTGNWYVSSFDATQNSSDFIDYPLLGFNNNWVVLTSNDFLAGGNVESMVYVMDRSALYGGSAGNVYEFVNNGGLFTISPALTYDITQNTEYLVSNANGDQGGTGYVQVGSITGTPGAPVYNTGTTLGVDQPWNDNPVMASQAGSGQTIDDDDDRMMDAIYINGSLWFCHTVFLPATGPSYSGVDWWEINPATPSLKQFGRISTANVFYYYPSINVNANGDALLGYCESSSSSGVYASAAYSFHAATDAANTMETSYLYKPGLAGYYKTLGGGENRWGDFTGTTVDPVDNSFFNLSQWANTGNNWATVIAHVPPSSTTCLAKAAFTSSISVSCTAPLTVVFSNASTNASAFTWYFGDGDTSTAVSPSHTYTAAGVYSVKLVASSSTGCGKDSITITDLVNISSANTCTVTLPINSGSSPLQTACTGIVYSDNGDTGLYSSEVTSTVTISPTGASGVHLHFTKFRMENGYDYLYVYNGPSTASPLLGSYTGYTIPADITSTSSSVTLEEKTDEFTVDSGFAVDWTCILPTTPPVANFSDNVTSCSGLVRFTDLSVGAQSWLWNFGDGDTSILENPTHTYFTNGTYTVSLTVTNKYGTNTKTVSNITINEPAAPTVSGGETHCGPVSVTLSASTSDSVVWYDSSRNIVSTTNPFVTPTLNTTTTYYAAQSVQQSIYTVGPATDNFGTGSYYTENGATWGPIFNVNTPCTLVSVYVYAQGAGDRTIYYVDSAGDVLDSVTADLPNGGSRVTLNFPLTVGGNYSLQFADFINVYRNESGAVYPYTDALNMVSIIGNTAPASAKGYYYFFYDWDIQPQNCVSQAASVTITINPEPAATLTATNVTCFGSSNGQVIAHVAAGTPTYAYQWSNNSISDTISDLTAGTYTVTVLDSKRCSVTASTTITAPSSGISATATSTNASCGGSTGSVSVTAAGGAPGYTYHWNGGQTTDTIHNAAPGNYTVTVTDLNNCSITASTTVTSSGALTLDSSFNNVTCHGDANGSVTIIPTGKTPYHYHWSSSATDTATLSGLSGGVYNVTVTDGNGCTAATAVTVVEPAILAVSLTPSDARCGQSNGSVSSTVSGGTPGYKYFWNTTDTIANISNLPAGNYSVTVYDANLCTALSSTMVTASGSLGVTDSMVPVSCFGDENGAVYLTPSGGTSPYSYQWSINNDTTASVSNLGPGNYSFTITDVHQCSVESSATVTAPSASLSVSDSVTNVLCAGQQNGSAHIVATGGVPGYSYNWNRITADSIATGLAAGSYIVTVSDSRQCTAVDTVSISQPSPINLVITGQNIACYGEETGSAEVKVVGGTAPYSYAWNTGSIDSVLNDLGSGNYWLTLTDANGCKDSSSISITQPSSALSISTSVSGSTKGPNTGSVEITISGGNLPYTVQWSTGGSGYSIKNLAGGNYSYTVTDGNTCVDTGTVHVTSYTGIENVSSGILAQVFPNPSTGLVNVVLHLADNSNRVNITVSDVLGNTLANRSFEPTQDIQTTFAMDSYASGIYFMEIRCGNDHLVKKIVLDK